MPVLLCSCQVTPELTVTFVDQQHVQAVFSCADVNRHFQVRGGLQRGLLTDPDLAVKQYIASATATCKPAWMLRSSCNLQELQSQQHVGCEWHAQLDGRVRCPAS
jgi:hypothetical protein